MNVRTVGLFNAKAHQHRGNGQDTPLEIGIADFPALKVYGCLLRNPRGPARYPFRDIHS